MTVEEAIKTAIVYETRVRLVYDDAAGRVADRAGKKVLQVLAREERDHIAYLESRLEAWRLEGVLTAGDIKSALPSAEAIADRLAGLEPGMAVVGSGDDLDLLGKALEAEIETSSFYRKMVEELPEPGRMLFARFLEIEEGHRAIVQAEIDSLNGTGYWFDIREFDLEAG